MQEGTSKTFGSQKQNQLKSWSTTPPEKHWTDEEHFHFLPNKEDYFTVASNTFRLCFSHVIFSWIYTYLEKQSEGKKVLLKGKS